MTETGRVPHGKISSHRGTAVQLDFNRKLFHHERRSSSSMQRTSARAQEAAGCELAVSACERGTHTGLSSCLLCINSIM